MGAVLSNTYMYTKEEVYNATLEYFNGNDMRASIWMDKYALKNNGEFLEKTPDDMHKRLAKEFARIEQKYPNPLSYEEIYSLLEGFRWIIPGGSILYGVGNNFSISSLGNCFVIGNSFDSYGSIFATDQEQAQLMKRRAGVGHDISHLRPNLAPVTNAAGTSSGVVHLMERFSNTTREVGQNNRRGALMLTLNISHPDSKRFIESKDDLTKITGANISVKLTDEFMKAVENNSDYDLYFEGKPSMNITTVEAKSLWNQIIHQAWKSAEPGVLFWDTISNESIPSCYGEEWKETSTNPCGEIPLCPYDSCRLMSINLYSFVENTFTDKAHFNYDKFKDVVYKAQRLMDDIIDLEEEKINIILNKIENDPEPDEIKAVEKELWQKIKRKLIAGRRTGLSAIGLADCFAGLNCTYGESVSIALAEEIYKQFAISAYKSSIDMARERGAFPIWRSEKEKDNPFIKRLFNEIHHEFSDSNSKYWDTDRFIDSYYATGRRNIALLTIPPSGTISMMAGISSGIEPVYQLFYKRRVKVTDGSFHNFVDQSGDKWKEYAVFHPKFMEYCRQKELFELDDMEKYIKESPYYKSTAYEIDPISRVHLQASIQKWIDHSISSTINLPEDTTEETVSNIYMEAWKSGCKGITIYRNNCRTGVLVDVDKKDAKEFKQHDAPKRPKELLCDVHTVKIKGETFYVLVGLLEEKPYEIFITNYNGFMNQKNGKIIKDSSKNYRYQSSDRNIPNITETLTDDQAAVTRLVSTALRHGADIKFIVEQLNKTQGDLTSFSKAIARALKTYIKDNEKTNKLCPECNSELVYESGCETCKLCGYSKCG